MADGIVGSSSATPAYNGYKFSYYRNAAANTGNAAFAQIVFDTAIFDTSSNVASGTFTAPVSGFYQFNARCSVQSGTALIISLYKNGSEYHRGADMGGGSRAGVTVSALVQLAAADTVDIRVFGSTAIALDVGSTAFTYFNGFLVTRA